MPPTVDSIPPGSTVLVTGANGLLGSNITEEFLAAGYHVIGTVRSATRCAWLPAFFSSRTTTSTTTTPRGRFTLHELPDLESEPAYAALLAAHSSISAICLTTSVLDPSQTDPRAVIPAAVRCVLPPLRAAAKAEAGSASAPSVKKVVLTGSAFGAWTPRAGGAGGAAAPRRLTAASYNEEAVAAAWDEGWDEGGKGDAVARGAAVLMAAFVEKERAAWRFVEEEEEARLGFGVDVVLVGTVLGRVLRVEEQGWPSTVGFLAGVWEGGEAARAARAFVKPQFFVDAVDCARVHVVAAVRGDVVGERVYAFGERFSWNGVLRILKRRYPQRTFDDEDEGEGEFLVEAPNERGAGLLRDMGQSGWTILEDSVVKTVETAKLLSSSS
ncbi:nad-dependent epimerase dehydratase [Diplodia corticola]|uniref:Nad-dependent epimerase dehydratase n=1 Tax=Diplodia corticola TaxID=236234 RepID=A0A1J9QLQ2_9PEZI|nr:nad-dependent epimerase dehydratase [Diplodia corticola]OJD28994.1 nad-dependent epimerase dehydratase [Diplodia corticola]